MSNQQGRFIAVGENIHCTRIFKVGGKYAREDGSIVYSDGGEERILPVPQAFTEGEDWKNGKVKHAAIGIWQALNGTDSEQRQAGVDYIRFMARRQEESDAGFLDLNVDEYGSDVAERLEAIRWLVNAVQSASSLPMSIDSSNMEVLRAGLAECGRGRAKPMVNSVSLERHQAIEIAKQAGACVVAGAGSETSMPSSTEDRVENLDRLVALLDAAGIGHGDIYFDPLVFPISVDPANGRRIMESVAQLRVRYGDQVHFAPGLSNISFGMPRRRLLNQVFTHLCREQGLDGGIVDPLQINGRILDEMDTGSEAYALARAVLTGEDDFGMEYITACREGRI